MIMKEFFEDIFKYHHHFNQKLADLFMEHRAKISQRTIPLFSHVLNAHQIWNSRILGVTSFGVHQLHKLEDFKTIDESNFGDTLKILSAFDLNKQVRYKTSKGDEFQNSIQEILFHTANHSTHHKGQLISDLRQSGIEPIVTDYIFYKR